jgi:ATP-dependent Clp protease adaptor protein ClpS
MANKPREQEEAEVVTEAKTEVRRPPLYKVLLLNDDYTTQNFVVYILQTIFNHPKDTAVQIMLHVHTSGIGIAGLFPYEIAEAKTIEVHRLARANEFPLRCSIEPE